MNAPAWRDHAGQSSPAHPAFSGSGKVGCSPNGLVGRDGVGVLLSCQSGVWRKNSGFDGNYVGLGSYTSRYDGRNNGSGTMLVYVYGGQSTVNKRVSGGDSCLNTWALSA